VLRRTPPAPPEGRSPGSAPNTTAHARPGEGQGLDPRACSRRMTIHLRRLDPEMWEHTPSGTRASARTGETPMGDGVKLRAAGRRGDGQDQPAFMYAECATPSALGRSRRARGPDPGGDKAVFEAACMGSRRPAAGMDAARRIMPTSRRRAASAGSGNDLCAGCSGIPFWHGGTPSGPKGLDHQHEWCGAAEGRPSSRCRAPFKRGAAEVGDGAAVWRARIETPVGGRAVGHAIPA